VHVLGPTGNSQGSIWCYNLQSKQVIKRRTVTPLPMPNRVIRRIQKLGKLAKQTRTSKRIEFLNRKKEKFGWDIDDPDDEVLLRPPIDTDTLPAELPGVPLAEDFAGNDVIEASGPTDSQRAAAARANANLDPTAPSAEITGVDYCENFVHPFQPDDPDGAVVVSDDEEDDKNGDDDIEFMGANTQNEENDNSPEVIDLGSDDEADLETDAAVADLGEDEDAMSDGAVAGLRRSKRKKIKKGQTVFDFDNRMYQVEDGVLHINPAALEQTKQSFKILDNDKPLTEQTSMRISVRAPRAAGIDPKALELLYRPKKLPSAGETSDAVVLHVVGVILAQQYTVNKGLKLFGERAKESISKELQQLHDYVTYTPVHAHELTRDQRKEALASLIFLTEKRCGKLKTRACVNGNPQRDYIDKETTASPTVMTDSVMITSAIEAHEGRKVWTCDIPGAFLHTNLDEEVIMLLRGQLADLMVQIDPDLYGPYLIKNAKGESILYVRMLKAMYGLLRSALLFYLKLVEDLKADGFEMNEYDPCVANKMVNGTQMTVCWHVDDLKVSHKEEAELQKFMDYLSSKYGGKLVVHKGDVHDYLGIDMDFSETGKVKMSMIKHLQKVFDDFPEEIGRAASSPASDHLFQVRDPAETEKLGKFLSKERKKDFHHSVAQLLFVSTRVRRDIQTTVAFLTTRVKKPDEDDWGKLKRLLKYLKGTKHMKLTLTVDNLSIIRWWVDASYNVHEDCKGQTGAMMSLGKGAPISFSRKQKCNVRSSCEGELVGIDDALPTILWTRYFIESQGYTVEQNIMFQDNKSTILLANNGRWSSSKRTKHIKSRFFYVKDKVNSGELSIEHRPTDKMWSDMLTKPKQGIGMRTDRAELQNCDIDYDDEKERLRTDPRCLPRPDDEPMKVQESTDPNLHRRSVLEKEQNRTNKKNVAMTWTTSDKVDRNNVKLRERHLELVAARVIRDKQRWLQEAKRGRE
jgi:hypothetical protein